MQIDNNLVTGLAPHGGLSFESHKVMLGENYVKIYGITKYPPSLKRGWASKISNMPNVTMCQMYEPCDGGAMIVDFSKSAATSRGLAETTRDVLERQRAEKSAIDAEGLMKHIDEDGVFVN